MDIELRPMDRGGERRLLRGGGTVVSSDVDRQEQCKISMARALRLWAGWKQRNAISVLVGGSDGYRPKDLRTQHLLDLLRGHLIQCPNLEHQCLPPIVV